MPGPSEPTGDRTPLVGAAAGDDPSASARERGLARGRALLSPRLWRRAIREYLDDLGPSHAAHVAFFAFLSLPPTILILFGLAGFFGGESLAIMLTETLEDALPGDASELVHGFVDQVVRQQAPGPFSIGILILLWAGSNVFMALTRSIEMAGDVTEDETRRWITQRALTVGVFLVFAALFLVASGILLAGPHVAAAIDVRGVVEFAWAVVQWPLAFTVIVVAIWFCYMVLPGRSSKGERINMLIGAVIAACFWLLATAGFRLYINNFADYAETYGFLGAVIVLQLWLWISANVVLFGSELASELPGGHRQRRASALSTSR